MKKIIRPGEIEVDPDNLRIRYTAPQEVEAYSDALVPHENRDYYVREPSSEVGFVRSSRYYPDRDIVPHENRNYRVSEPSNEVGFANPSQSYTYNNSLVPSIREVGWGDNLSNALSGTALALGEGIGAGATGALGLAGIGAGATMAGAGQLIKGTGALLGGGGKLVLATAEGAGKLLKGAGDLVGGVGRLGLGGAAIVGNAIKGAVVGAGEAASKAIVAYNESRNNELEKRYREATDEKIKLAAQIAKITNELTTLQTARSEAQSQIAKLQADLAIKDNNITALKQEIEASKAKSSTSTRNIKNGLAKQIAAREKAETQLRIRQQQYSDDLKAYAGRLGKLTAQNQILQENLVQVTNYANDLQSQIAAKQKDIDQLLTRPIEQQIVIQKVPVPGPVQYREVPRIETQIIKVPIKPAKPLYRTVKNPAFFETFNPKARQHLKPRKKRPKTTRVFSRIGGF